MPTLPSAPTYPSSPRLAPQGPTGRHRKPDGPEPAEPRPDTEGDGDKDPEPGKDLAGEILDVRAGGDPDLAPPSLSAVEARWHDHESSGSSWDDPESM